MTTPAILTRIIDAEKNLDNIGLNFNKYGLGAWSPSKIKMLEKCPYQFYLQYILKIKPDSTPDTSMADVGTTAHRILEHVVQGKSIDDAYSLTKREHCNVPEQIAKPGVANLTEQQWQNSIITLENSIVIFKDNLEAFERKNKVNRRLTELKLGVTKDWKPTTFFAKDVYFRGIIDLVLEIEFDGQYAPDGLIIDHKHGGGEFGGGVRNYEQQLDSYKPLYHIGHSKTSGIQTGIHFIKAGKMAYGEYSDADAIEKKMVNKIEWNIEGAIDTVTELGFFKHVRGGHCQWCPYNDVCKPGMLKENELSTKKYFPIKKVDS